ncbi:hypothetical protein CDL12_14860 [Handroanthus impetiginosus]|uniref:AP2/ERF domain-containing protein n=1 Tax=Handroanthus impetiginosus TaxID=429701 RepID=A0A2G9H4V5_9LAMI|nr:hypothetical protein CDL12_14860 [Handroanthus impetiginosus]
MAETPPAAARPYAAASSSNAGEPRLNEVKYKGVRKRKWGKYVSEIRLPNSRERIWLGSYDTAEKAARAFDASLFCLRGPNAKFNFPDEPPNIAGGEMLTPAEIQSVAQHYANTYSGGSSNQPQPPARPLELEDTSPSSNSEGAGPIESIDWSFLDMLDSNTEDNAGRVSDFGLYDDVYNMSPHYTHDGNDNDDNDDDHGDGGHVPSNFLWNF